MLAIFRNSTYRTLYTQYHPKWRSPEGEVTGISVYNHTMGCKVPLVLRNPDVATWYTCGPTVYDTTHLGHASTYVKVDILQRILRDYFKINLVTAMNITDVDDKIIKRCRETGLSWKNLTRAYVTEFQQDMLKLNVMSADLQSNVSDNVPSILAFIENLMQSKQAYAADDGSIYFDVSQYKHYGKLQKLPKRSEESQFSTTKKNSADFALWKIKKDSDEPSWKTPWGGEGRPGWHIECSAIASLFFGSQVDFHAGGLDLRFPHHENEEAQCCARFQTDQWVNYWIHTGQLNIRGDSNKMSKSLRNTISISDMLRSYSADEFRMACLLSNYRNAMPYSDELMIAARNTLQKFKNFISDVNAYASFLKPPKLLDEGALKAQLKHTRSEFDSSLRDDFDTARSISVLIDQISSISRCINEQQVDAEEDPSHCFDVLIAARNFICEAMYMYGIQQLDARQSSHIEQHHLLVEHPRPDVNALVADMLLFRNKLRAEAFSSGTKNSEILRVCDDLRQLLLQHGIEIRDHKKGSSWVQKRSSDIN